MRRSETAANVFLENSQNLEISRNLQENICARVPFLIKLQA